MDRDEPACRTAARPREVVGAALCPPGSHHTHSQVADEHPFLRKRIRRRWTGVSTTPGALP